MRGRLGSVFFKLRDGLGSPIGPKDTRYQVKLPPFRLWGLEFGLWGLGYHQHLVSIYIYVYIYVCIYIYICVYTYIYRYTGTRVFPHCVFAYVVVQVVMMYVFLSYSGFDVYGKLFRDTGCVWKP